MSLNKTLDKAVSMNDLADMAVKELAKLKNQNKPIVQICGPMSTGGAGNLELNMARFQLAIETARRKGLLVFNQLPFQDAIVRLTKYTAGAPYAMDILEVFYRKIFESGYIKKALFLPDWQSSKGATWEHNFVKSLGIVVEDYPNEWLSGLETKKK